MYTGSLVTPKQVGRRSPSAPPSYQRCLAVDDSRVYGTGQEVIGVHAVAKQGGAVEVIVRTTSGLHIVTDETDVYWRIRR